MPRDPTHGASTSGCTGTEADGLRVSVLGAGVMGKRHARVFASLPDDFRLAGVFDADPAAAGEAVARWSVCRFETEEEAILAADLVVVASPAQAHAATAARAIAAGRHLLVEKPLCTDAAQALELVRPRDERPLLFVGHSERFNPVIRVLRAAVPRESIRAMSFVRTALEIDSRRERGAVFSLAVHDLDLAAFLAASPVRICAVRSVSDSRLDVTVAAEVGATARVVVDAAAAKRDRRVEITTDDAVYSGNLIEKTLTRRAKGTGEVSTWQLPTEEPLVAQAKAIARSLRGEMGDVATALDGARTVWLTEGLRRARRRGSLYPAGP